jgi:ribonuclease Z
MKIPVYFLGTGHAVPTKKRNHLSMLLKYKSENILVDCGEGTQRQFRKANLNPCSITKILLTHFHGDHILGLPGLFQTLALNGYNKTLEIYCPKNTSRFLEQILKIFVFEGKIKTKVIEVEQGRFFENQDFYLEAIKMDHNTPCLAYSFIEKDKLRIDKKKLKKYKLTSSPLLQEIKKGKSITHNNRKIMPKDITYLEKGKKITFILDTGKNQKIDKISKKSDLLVCESTYASKEKELAAEYKHLTSEDAAHIAKKSKSKNLILLHISQRYENKEKTILSEAKKIFANTRIVEDLDKIEI